jgi:hypothetical protein
MAEAGLGDVEIRPYVGTVRFASPEDFLAVSGGSFNPLLVQ